MPQTPTESELEAVLGPAQLAARRQPSSAEGRPKAPGDGSEPPASKERKSKGKGKGKGKARTSSSGAKVHGCGKLHTRAPGGGRGGSWHKGSSHGAKVHTCGICGCDTAVDDILLCVSVR